ncbi:fimbrial protein [Serratia rubidaea]|uniref:fimbrial protein n=1 Tax=Serratia rubidaea TaxID=61652 RepID=UPI0013791476|nr:fimbrial protein [Serratia rubidaea]QPR64279.1 type 1 fimbrial protein [Serratia rubidaea]HAY0638354.1 type 1 fimbrial protein [Serratia rubidaea]
MNINVGTLNNLAEQNIGAVVFSRTVSLDSVGSHFGIRCGAYTRFNIYGSMSGSPESGYSGVYRTNIPGLGIRVSMWSDTIYHETPTTPTVAPFTWRIFYNTSENFDYNYGSGYIQVRVELIKTAEFVESGNLSYQVNNILVAEQLPVQNLNVTGRVIGGCSVSNSAINVPLGIVPSNRFSGPGDTAQPTDFNISLRCSVDTRVSVRFDGTADGSGATGVIALDPPTSGSAAEGVGIQIIYNDLPVPIGSDIYVLTPSSNGNIDVPFIAQYYQTRDRINSGQANGTVTFTMSYD